MRRSKFLLLVAVVLLSACAETGNEETNEPDPAAEPFLLEVVADDFSYEFTDEVPAGPLEIRLENAGTEPHQALVYKLNEGVVYEDYLEAVLDDDSQVPALSSRAGGVNYGISPGDVEIHEEPDPLPAGTYAVICFIKETESGKNHYELGMIAPLTVQ